MTVCSSLSDQYAGSTCRREEHMLCPHSTEPAYGHEILTEYLRVPEILLMQRDVSLRKTEKFLGPWMAGES